MRRYITTPPSYPTLRIQPPANRAAIATACPFTFQPSSPRAWWRLPPPTPLLGERNSSISSTHRPLTPLSPRKSELTLARRTLHDHFFKQAKAEGYLARSAYKLQQIQHSKRLIRTGDRVLDLGCAPGAWLQVASELVGPSGFVLGVDLQAVRHAFPPTVRTIVADAYSLNPDSLLGDPPALFAVILSDMAPNTTGHGDDLVSARLCDRVLELLPHLLAPGGALAMKIFEGAEYSRILRAAAHLFASAKGYKPTASRDVSREMYIIAQGFAPPQRHATSTRSPL